MGWEQWADAHGRSDQIKRQSSATKGACTPLRIDGSIGYFQGTGGEYKTSLDSCSCVDFSRRKIPCKHMYRLAIELGVFDSAEQVENDLSALSIPRSQQVQILSEIVDILGKYESDEQLRLMNIICDLTYRKLPESFSRKFPLLSELEDFGLLTTQQKFSSFPQHYRKKDLLSMIETHGIDVPPTEKTQKAKIQWVCDRLDTFGPELFPNDVVVTMASTTLPLARRLYKHLYKEFNGDDYY